MKYDMLKWCNSVMVDDAVQLELESKITRLLEGPLKGKSEYAQEKCIKSFYEGLVYLEKLLLKEREVHPHDTPIIMNKIRNGHYTVEEAQRRQLEVRTIMISEISRQFKHYLAFL